MAMNKPNNIQEKLDTYYTLQKEIEAVYSASAQLHWDYATHMPSKASA
jgi:Zn-dependent M32 family carboxypeptidase